MPKRSKTAGNAAEMEAFGRRLVAILQDAGHPRRGAGRYLADRYRVSTVTANAWLNGEHRAEATLARRIAEDHGSSFDQLYFGRAARANGGSADPGLSAAERALLDRYRGTDDVGRRMIDELVGVVLSQQQPQDTTESVSAPPRSTKPVHVRR
ncbi:hypothetical protein [Luteimonas saliphila]|uniref:hypothetical protein n=1 Tax=Luteimonas saliphila TaxID=2804919 RepID=UPI00192D4ADC|nr:hypothetical protein [Luteimonas saliphila]